MFYLQVEVDWEKINAKIDMELKNEASRANLQENKRILKWRPFWNEENE